MPTAAKLTAAVAFAILGLIAAVTFVPHLPEGSQIGMFRELTAAIGFIVGWTVMGGLAGHGYSDAVGSGLRTAVTLTFFALLGFSTYLMIQRSFKMIYDGPLEAVLGVFEFMFEYGHMMLAPDVLGVLAVGGVLGGMVTEWAGRRWS